MSDVVPTLLELENELRSVADWEALAVQLGLEWYEVESIRKDEQVGSQAKYSIGIYMKMYLRKCKYELDVN